MEKGHFIVMTFRGNFGNWFMPTMINVLRQVEFWNETFWSRGHVQHFATNTVWHCTTASENSISASDYGTVVAAFKFQVRCFFSIKPAIRPHLLHFLLWWKYSTTFLSCCCNSFWYETSDIFCFIKKKVKKVDFFVYFINIKNSENQLKSIYLHFSFVVIYS